MPTQQISDAKYLQAFEDYTAGKRTVRSFAVIWGVSPAQLYAKFAEIRAGIHKIGRKLTVDEKDEIVALHQQGVSLQDLAVRFRKPVVSIRYILNTNDGFKMTSSLAAEICRTVDSEQPPPTTIVTREDYLLQIADLLRRMPPEAGESPQPPYEETV